MIIGIMQPYFMPYLGYWQLMNAVDKFVIYDDGKYRPRGWINRNRILINSEPKYITIPLNNGSPNVLIKDVRIAEDKAFQNKILRTLQISYSRAPFYEECMNIIESTINYKTESLTDYLYENLMIIKKYLEIKTDFFISSNIPKRKDIPVQQKVIDICNFFNADIYYNAIGGKDLYSKAVFQESGILLKFLQMNPIAYRQFCHNFVSELSIIDVLMFNGVEKTKQMLNQYTLQ